ncbi:EF-hand domain-containing protein [Luteolibacter flavescens]|uniref:EF-hand domain-containing protein n=1 Tax=Luteolibacter flavescens TaxID=1859460 RepID=A0ABT3FQ11_9BACT|nr:EF-hand domain-containing protein [Luteolibacter flavescens]MCW1885404.1 EF-hand domain-containing protein [Luteolibacter flavescens]
MQHNTMTNRNSTLISGLRTAAVALTFSGAAFAGLVLSPGTIDFNEADTDESGGLTVEEYTTTLPEGTSNQKIKRSFKKADTDRSGLISLNEYLIAVGEIEPPTKEEISFAAADENSNGSISLEEFYDTFGNTVPIEIIKRFLKADADESNGLSLAEWTLYKKGKAKGPEGAKYYKFDLADRDNNDELTMAEFALTFPKNAKETTVAKKFAKEDSDDNGVLTRDEWNPGAPKVQPVL